jgi:hypothetical protein
MKTLLIVSAFPLVVFGADEPKTAATKKTDTIGSTKSDDIVLASHIGNLTGVVEKFDKSSITIKVAETVVTGITRRHVGGHSARSRGHTVAVPKYGIKQVSLTYPVGDKVTVKTASGKDVTLAEVVVGETVEIHLDKIKEGILGEKLETHVEVKRIDVPNAAAKK